MKRLFCVIPEQSTCEKMVTELEQNNVPCKHVHVIGHTQTPTHHLPKASIWQKTELGHGLELGIGIGGIGGFLGGLLCTILPTGGIVLGNSALLAGTAIGAAYGAIVSAVMKRHERNHDLNQFEDAILSGKFIMLVDIPKQDEEAIYKLIASHHPEVEIHSPNKQWSLQTSSI